MLSALKNADNFMLCAHINPDGDAIGSMGGSCAAAADLAAGRGQADARGGSREAAF